MALRFTVTIVSLAALCLAAATTAQEKAAKPDEQAKMLAADALKALHEKDVDGLMKIVAVPFLMPDKDQLQTVTKTEELKKQLTSIAERKKEESFPNSLKDRKVSFEVKTYERFLGPAGQQSLTPAHPYVSGGGMMSTSAMQGHFAFSTLREGL
jgi:hypothetical protein